jgi:hypothetical protein
MVFDKHRAKTRKTPMLYTQRNESTPNPNFDNPQARHQANSANNLQDSPNFFTNHLQFADHTQLSSDSQAAMKAVSLSMASSQRRSSSGGEAANNSFTPMQDANNFKDGIAFLDNYDSLADYDEETCSRPMSGLFYG